VSDTRFRERDTVTSEAVSGMYSRTKKWPQICRCGGWWVGGVVRAEVGCILSSFAQQGHPFFKRNAKSKHELLSHPPHLVTQVEVGVQLAGCQGVAGGRVCAVAADPILKSAPIISDAACASWCWVWVG